MIPFIVITVSLIAMIIVAFYISNLRCLPVGITSTSVQK
mgnify:CR=1 FL=1